jgi:hypothetical protein
MTDGLIKQGIIPRPSLSAMSLDQSVEEEVEQMSDDEVRERLAVLIRREKVSAAPTDCPNFGKWHADISNSSKPPLATPSCARSGRRVFPLPAYSNKKTARPQSRLARDGNQARGQKGARWHHPTPTPFAARPN